MQGPAVDDGAHGTADVQLGSAAAQIDAAQAQAVCRVVVVERAGELAVDQQQTDELRAA